MSMTKLKTFWVYRNNSWSDAYQDINESVNEYARDNNLIIKQFEYDRLSDSLIANVLFYEGGEDDI